MVRLFGHLSDVISVTKLNRAKHDIGYGSCRTPQNEVLLSHKQRVTRIMHLGHGGPNLSFCILYSIVLQKSHCKYQETASSITFQFH